MVTKYISVYGVEPYNPRGVPLAADTGGGADVTQQNLLITLWKLTTPQVVSGGGTRVKPFMFPPVATPIINQYGPGISRQQFNSRLSAKFMLASIDSYNDAPNYLAVLQTPSEVLEGFLINEQAGATAFALKNPFASQFCWDSEIVNAVNRQIVEDADVTFGTVANGSLPLLAKTDGSDGNYPQFWDMASAATYNALRAGAAAYACCLMQFDNPDTPQDALVKLSWPYSGGSRG
jgi:hypothetical protein